MAEIKEDAETISTTELLVVALQLCDMVHITAPAFAEGSYGSRVVAVARAYRPRLAAMLAAERDRKPHVPAQSRTTS